jgi:hypothetical protein
MVPASRPPWAILELNLGKSGSLLPTTVGFEAIRATNRYAKRRLRLNINHVSVRGQPWRSNRAVRYGCRGSCARCFEHDAALAVGFTRVTSSLLDNLLRAACGGTKVRPGPPVTASPLLQGGVEVKSRASRLTPVVSHRLGGYYMASCGYLTWTAAGFAGVQRASLFRAWRGVGIPTRVSRAPCRSAIPVLNEHGQPKERCMGPGTDPRGSKARQANSFGQRQLGRALNADLAKL